MRTKSNKQPFEFSLQIDGVSQQVRVVPKQKLGGYVIEINEKRFEVDLSPHVDLQSFIVSVDRCPFDVLGGDLFSTNELVIDDKSYEISFGKERKSPVVSFHQSKTQDIQKASPRTEITDPGRTITAPMPGVILSISVELEQNVQKDEVLMIFEAMKMENRITSPRDGAIKEIFVKAKDRINRGDPLFVIE
ncbi:MAG: acetyl-CoA carboxylase biotin carboxyl carrier protein subunit [Candidatus Heimdallarchaeota archaeon]